MEDLFPKKPDALTTYCANHNHQDKPFWFDTAKYSIEAVYDYVDESGKILFQTVRLKDHNGGKTYRQRRPDGTGGWIGSLTGVRRVLYKLPSVIEAIRNKTPIYLVEGEKCADRLIQEGVVATTNPLGAEKWDGAYTDTLKNAEVYFIPDFDKSGARHRDLVMGHLDGVVKSLKVLNHIPGIEKLGDKADIYEWLEAGHTRTELEALLNQSEPGTSKVEKPSSILSRGMPASDLAVMEFPPVEWLADGFLPHGLIILAGKGKVGKSWMALDLALNVTSGDLVLGRFNSLDCDVLYLALEDGERRLNQRIRKLLGNKPAPSNLILFPATVGWKRLDQGGLEELKKCLDERPDIRLVVIDTFQKVKPVPRRSNNAYENDYAAMHEVHKLATTRGISILLIHHTRKAACPEDVFDEVSGSVGTTASADTVMVLKKERVSNHATLTLTSRDTGEKKLDLLYDPDTCKWSVAANSIPFLKSREREHIYEAVAASDRPLDAQEINEALKRKGIEKHTSTLRYLLAEMFKSGELERPEPGKYTVPHNPTNKQINVKEEESLLFEEAKHTQQPKQTNNPNTQTASSSSVDSDDPFGWDPVRENYFSSSSSSDVFVCLPCVDTSGD